MELNKFVSDTLQQILEGVREASKAQSDHKDGGQVNPHPVGGSVESEPIGRETRTVIQNVEFDVAVTVGKAKQTKGGILVVVGPVTLGAGGKSDSSDSMVSRIKFTVPLGLPRP